MCGVFLSSLPPVHRHLPIPNACEVFKRGGREEDLSLIYNLRKDSAEALRRCGVDTIDMLAVCDVETLPKIRGFSIETLRKAKV